VTFDTYFHVVSIFFDFTAFPYVYQSVTGSQNYWLFFFLRAMLSTNALILGATGQRLNPVLPPAPHGAVQAVLTSELLTLVVPDPFLLFVQET
jgi:hypothetical protein